MVLVALARRGGCGHCNRVVFATLTSMSPTDFAHASESVKALNPDFFGAPLEAESRGNALLAQGVGAPLPSRDRMNKTEREFGAILEAMKRGGEIVRYEYEGLSLRWSGMRYTPDFVVILGEVQRMACGIRLIEVKGPHIWDRDIVRFKGARAYWPEFAFEMWQKARGEWRRLF